MYSGKGFRSWEIGDIDVFIHDGLYHLFHLIIPNHDYIAHATSEDGIHWQRQKNALFVGDPGQWDDDMLWTMHVSCEHDHFVMYYTGLSRKDAWVSQRIGRAVSEDLMHWKKESLLGLPLGSQGPYYEQAESNNPRQWLSFRDPFKFVHKDQTYLLVCGRKAEGPVSRRGCVSLVKLESGVFQHQPPLFSPNVYDDVECPCLFEIGGRFFLLGSIREDIKVRYWSADSFQGDYKANHNNLLLPKGNYAARAVIDGERVLVYNFYFKGRDVDTHRSLPPPKQIQADADGELYLSSYYRWPEKICGTLSLVDFPSPIQLLGNSKASFTLVPKDLVPDLKPEDQANQANQEKVWALCSESAYEVFAFEKPAEALIWEGTVQLEGLGKFGLVMDVDRQGNGYWVTIDVINGYVKIRAWGFNELDVHNNFIHTSLQANHFKPPSDNSLAFQVIRYGGYFELSLNGRVVLTLIDDKYTHGLMGIYLSSCRVRLLDSQIHLLASYEAEYCA